DLVLKVLRGALHNQSIRYNVLGGLRHPRAGEILRLLIPDLLKMMTEVEDLEASSIAQTLATLKFDLDKDAPFLLSLLQAKEPAIRRARVGILAAQPVEVKFVPLLQRLVNDEDKQTRTAALELICRYAGEGKADPQHLVYGLLKDWDATGEPALEAI